MYSTHLRNFTYCVTNTSSAVVLSALTLCFLSLCQHGSVVRAKDFHTKSCEFEPYPDNVPCNGECPLFQVVVCYLKGPAFAVSDVLKCILDNYQQMYKWKADETALNSVNRKETPA